MKTLSRGQKIRLAELSSSTQLQVRLECKAGALGFDFSCFGLDENGKLSDDRYFVFYNQKQSPGNELKLLSFDASSANFSLDAARLPMSVRRLVFVATVDGAGDMSQLKAGRFVLSDASGEIGEFSFAGSDFASEKAVMVAEIYFKGEWRVAANGQGFKEGLSAVLRHFGGQEIEQSATQASQVKVAKVPLPPIIEAPAKVNDIPPVAPPKKVTLQKADSKFKIDLSKGKQAGEIVATAQWIDNGDNRSDNDDLDLRAGILFPDGRMSIVTCKSRGSLQKAPFIVHDGDVKQASRNAPGQETIRVNPQIAEKSGGKVAIVFSIYSAVANGVVSIASLKPQIKLQWGTQIVECNLDFSKSASAKLPMVYTYVIGIAIIGDGQIEISPGGQVSKPISEATPWLEWDEKGGVKVSMNGPMVVKGAIINGFGKRKYV